MTVGGENLPYALGDGARAAAAEGADFLDRLKAGQPAKITNADRKGDRDDIDNLKRQVQILLRAAHSQAARIGELETETRTLRAALVSVQSRLRNQTPPRTRSAPSAPARRRDGLDTALDRELYD